VHRTLAEELRALKRAHDALRAGRPLPLALREARVWGTKERLIERALPLFTDSALAQMLHAAQICDGLIKGLKHPDWPLEPWDGLRRLVLMVLQSTSATSTQVRGRAVVVPPRLALQA
jgi:DNA polymerase-3 subunit delta